MGEQEEYDFQTKIKLIDPTFNLQSKHLNKYKPYLHVSIFTKTFEEAPKVENIGDILYLKRFYLYDYDIGTGHMLLSARY